MPPKKDPSKPKGRTSAYAFFVQERRAMYREQGKEVDFTAFSKECAELWKGPDMALDAAKDKYISLAKEDRERYDQEMADYVPTDGSDKKGKKGAKRRKKKDKDPNMPKRAMSAFFWFAGDKRPKLKEQNPGATVGEIAKQLGAAWKIMTAEQKAPYEKSAKLDRSRYDAQMSEYRKGTFTKPGLAEADDEDEEYSDED